MDIYMRLLAGFKLKSKDKYVLKLIKNLYGLKQGGYNFHEKLKSELETHDFIQSITNLCAFLNKCIIVLCHVCDCLLFA